MIRDYYKWKLAIMTDDDYRWLSWGLQINTDYHRLSNLTTDDNRWLQVIGTEDMMIIDNQKG